MPHYTDYGVIFKLENFMKTDNKSSLSSAIAKLFYLLVPVLLVVFGAYFFYLKFFVQKNIIKTQDDIMIVTKNIENYFVGRKIKDFNSNFMSYSNLLPFDLEINNSTGADAEIKNRFGGEMKFIESVATLSEQTLYFGLYKNQEKYKRVYQGVSSYVILFTKLKKRDCAVLSMIDWRRFIPFYLGMEASVRTQQHPNDGYFNLQNFILVENVNQKYKTKDLGITSRTPLSAETAKHVCNCEGKNCTFAVKFLHNSH